MRDFVCVLATIAMFLAVGTACNAILTAELDAGRYVMSTTP